MGRMLNAALFAAAGSALVAMALWAPHLVFQTLSEAELLFAGFVAVLAAVAEGVTFWRSAHS